MAYGQSPPKIVAEREINPNHPNLTIWRNKIDVCLFVGVHCHQSNIALKIIRGGTDCFTIALCTFSGDDEAHITIRDLTAVTIRRIVESVRRRRGGSQPSGLQSLNSERASYDAQKGSGLAGYCVRGISKLG